MQAILCAIFVIFSAFATVFSTGLTGLRQRTCKSLRPMRNFNEIRQQGQWIVFAGNLRCDGCCLTYDITRKKPGKIIVRNTNYTLSGPETPIEYTGTKIRPGTYKSETGLVYVLSTDYASYQVIYKQPGKFMVFVRSLAVLKDKCTRDKIRGACERQSRICGVKYYPYNIEKACLKYKPTD